MADPQETDTRTQGEKFVEKANELRAKGEISYTEYQQLQIRCAELDAMSRLASGIEALQTDVATIREIYGYK